MNSKAWLEGKAAGSLGSSKSNPYIGGQDMQAWLDGYKAGQNEAKQAGQKVKKS